MIIYCYTEKYNFFSQIFSYIEETYLNLEII